MNYRECQPPLWAPRTICKKVFLAGSIEMGKADEWQSRVLSVINDWEIISSYDIEVFNPRRSDWDSSWKQNKNNPKFYEQVTWELDHLDQADVIAMYFDSETLSPISLLELGLYASSGKLVVLCPTEFWRNGNVDIVCSKYGIPIFTDFDTWLVEIKNRLRK